MTFWTAVFMTYGYRMSPQTARVLATPLALSAVSSLVNNLWAALEKSSHEQ